MPELQKARTARFGPFEIDFSQGELRKHGLRLKVSGQPIRILEMLLENPGELVSREQIRERLWTANTFVDFDHGLNAAINKLREALGDTADNPTYIATVPRRGYRFIGEVLAAVRTEAEGPQQERPAATPIPVKKDHQRLLAVALALSCIVGLFLAYLLVGRKHDWQVTISREAQITTSSDLVIYPTFSPDATRLAYSVDSGHGYEIVMRQIGSADRELPITNDGQQNIQAAWSPDGQTIVYHSRKRGGIWAVPALGGTPRRITNFGSHPAWSRDGRWLAFQSGPVNDLGADAPGVFLPSVLWVVRPDGTDARQVTKAGTPEGGHGSPSWSPDGQHLVFVSIVAGMGLFTADIKTGEVKRLGFPAPVYFDPVYSVDGTSVFYGMVNPFSVGLFQMPVGKDGSKAGEPVQLRSGDARVRNLSLSRDGTKLLYSGATQISGIWSISANGKGFSDPAVLRQRMGDRTTVPKFSPDGQHLLVASWRVGVCCEIWMMKPDGSDALMLGSDGLHPKWLPDGKNTVYLSLRGKEKDVWTTYLQKLNAETRETEKLAEVPGNVQSLDISPDGRQMVYQTPIHGTTNLWILDLKSGERRQLTNVNDFIGFPVWSPDGSQITADAKRTDDDQAFIVSPRDGRLKQVTFDAGQHWPGSWTPDGKGIIMAAQHEGVWNVYALNLSTGIERPLTHYTSSNAYVRYPQLSPNGKQIVYEYTETRGNIWMLSLKQDQR